MDKMIEIIFEYLNFFVVTLQNKKAKSFEQLLCVPRRRTKKKMRNDFKLLEKLLNRAVDVLRSDALASTPVSDLRREATMLLAGAGEPRCTALMLRFLLLSLISS